MSDNIPLCGLVWRLGFSALGIAALLAVRLLLGQNGF